jgi:predicted nucleotidyltransferase
MSDQPETKGMIELVRRKYKLLQRDQKWGMAGVHDKEEISEINKRLKKFLYA